MARVGLEHAAQAHDEVVDGTRRGEGVVAPHAVEDLGARDDLPGLLGEAAQRPLTLIGYAVSILTLGWCVTRVRDLDSFGRQCVTVLLVFIVFGMPLFSPWYHLWWLPLVGVWQWPGWRRAFGAVAICGTLSHLVWVTTHEFGLAHEAWMWVVGLVAVVLVVLLGRSAPTADVTGPVSPSS